MNYFTELIESYNKLIKRKFSIVEAQAPITPEQGLASTGEAQAEAFVKTGANQKYDPSKRGGEIYFPGMPASLFPPSPP